jgi:hypothetical protein
MNFRVSKEQRKERIEFKDNKEKVEEIFELLKI